MPTDRALETGIADDPEGLRELLTSNLCRCAGYEGLRRSVVRAADAAERVDGAA